MRCSKCGNEISDKAWKIHQFMCSANKAQPAANVLEPSSAVQSDKAAVITPAGATGAIVPGTNGSGVVGDVASDSSAPKVAPAPAVASSNPQLSNQNGSEVFYPAVDPNFIVSQFIADALDDTEKISQKHPTNLLITGQPGGGKTSLAIQYPAKYRRPCVKADFGVVQEPQQLFQTTHLVEVNGHVVTETRESAFVKGIETPRCVIIMDEMTRVENERCLNPLMPLLDGSKSTWIDELHRRIHVADGVVFIATINEGSMFAGVASLDAALRDRFREVFMDYLPAEQECNVIQAKTGVTRDIAVSLAEFGYVVRHTEAISRKVSTRQLLHAAEAVAVGATLWRAVETAIGNYNDTAWRQQVMEIFSLNIKDQDEYVKWTNKPRRDSFVDYK